MDDLLFLSKAGLSIPAPDAEAPHCPGLLAIKDLSSDRRGTRFTAIANSGKTDRDGESIDPQGWLMPAPTTPIFFGHDGYRKAENWIGVIEKAYPGESFQIDGMLFDAIPEATNAKLVAGIIHLGVRPQGSVGFDPLEWKDADGRMGSRQKGDPWPGSRKDRRYTKQELLEWSIAPVPSDIGSVVTGVKMLRAAESLLGRSNPEGSAWFPLADLLLTRGSAAPAPDSPPEPENTDPLVARALRRAVAAVLRVLSGAEGDTAPLKGFYESLAERFAPFGIVAPEFRAYGELDLASIESTGHPFFTTGGKEPADRAGA